MDAISAYLKNELKLYTGRRTKEEDDGTYREVFELLFETIVEFILQHLPEEKVAEFNTKLETVEEGTEESSNEAMRITYDYLTSIPNWQPQLEAISIDIIKNYAQSHIS